MIKVLAYNEDKDLLCIRGEDGVQYLSPWKTAMRSVFLVEDSSGTYAVKLQRIPRGFKPKDEWDCDTQNLVEVMVYPDIKEYTPKLLGWGGVPNAFGHEVWRKLPYTYTIHEYVAIDVDHCISEEVEKQVAEVSDFLGSYDLRGRSPRDEYDSRYGTYNRGVDFQGKLRILDYAC